MALSEKQTIEIVQTALVRAGGYNEDHPGDRTLSRAGLKTGHQRESFQRKVARGVGEHNHKIINVGKIPNLASTIVSAVRAHIKKEAVPLEG